MKNQHNFHFPPACLLIWQTFLLVGICGLLSAQWPYPAIITALLLIIFDRRFWLPQRLALAALIFCATFAFAKWHFIHSENIINSPPAWLASKNPRIKGEIDSVQGLPGNRLRVTLKNVAPVAPAQPPLAGACVWTWDNPLFVPLRGQMLEITKSVKPARGFANWPCDNYQTYLFAHDIYWRIWSSGASGNPAAVGRPNFFAELRQKTMDHFIQSIRHINGSETLTQPQAILIALLFGDRRFLSLETANNFSQAALAHSLALSGQHLGLAIFISWGLMALIGYAYPSLYLFCPKHLLIILAAIPLALIYLWLGNAPASLIRAFAMLCIGGLWLLKGHRFSGLDLLFAALLAILCLNPLAIFDLGLQLSTLCVAIIIICWPAISRAGFHSITNTLSPIKKAANGIIKIFLVSFTIQLALLPLNLIQFQTPGFFFILNLFWLPLLGIIVLPFGALALIASCFTDIFPAALALEPSLAIAQWPCQLCIDMLDALSRNSLLGLNAFLNPHWSNLIAFGLLICGLFWLLAKPPFGKDRKRARNLVCLGLLFLAVGPVQRLWDRLFPPLSIQALDVG